MEDGGLLALRGERSRGDDGGSIASSATIWNRWFWTTSRSAPGALVEAAALADAEVLGERDLHARDVVAVPDRLEERVGEAEVEDVHDRLLAEVVVDPEDRLLGEDRPGDRVQLDRRREVAAERLFDDDARVAREPRRAEALDHGLEQRRRDGEVVRRPLRLAERRLQRREGRRAAVIAADVADQREQLVERRRHRRRRPRSTLAADARVHLVGCRGSSRRRRSPARSSVPRSTIA